MNISPLVAGFLKGILLAAIGAIVLYLSNAANLNGVVSPILATLIAAIASSIESNMKATSNGTTGLFGAVTISK